MVLSTSKKINQQMHLQKKTRGCVKKNLYLRILCKTVVSQRTGYFHDRHFEIIRIEVATS